MKWCSLVPRPLRWCKRKLTPRANVALSNREAQVEHQVESAVATTDEVVATLNEQTRRLGELLSNFERGS